MFASSLNPVIRLPDTTFDRAASNDPPDNSGNDTTLVIDGLNEARDPFIVGEQRRALRAAGINTAA